MEHGRDFAQSVQEVDERADIKNLIEILLEKGIAAWAIEIQMARLKARILAELEITEEILAGLQFGVRERIERIVSGEVLRRPKEQFAAQMNVKPPQRAGDANTNYRVQILAFLASAEQRQRYTPG